MDGGMEGCAKRDEPVAPRHFYVLHSRLHRFRRTFIPTALAKSIGVSVSQMPITIDIEGPYQLRPFGTHRLSALKNNTQPIPWSCYPAHVHAHAL